MNAKFTANLLLSPEYLGAPVRFPKQKIKHCIKTATSSSKNESALLNADTVSG